MKPARHFPLAAICALGGLTGWSAEPLIVSSKSGQFLVRGLPIEASAAASGPSRAVDYVRLDPNLLTVSLERIKVALLEELGLSDRWRGRIFVALHPRLADNQPIIVASIRHTDGWDYRLSLPEIVDRGQYIRAVAGVLLQEIANRESPGRQVEMPPWLLEGLTASWLNRPDPFLTPQMSAGTDGVPGRVAVAGPFGSAGVNLASGMSMVQGSPDPLEQSRATIRAGRPLTLDELNLPGEDLLHGSGAPLYRSCAHVFVASLLRLKQGRECLQEMLRCLPDYLNWQTAFLRAYREHFPRLVEVDKWWSLQVVRVTGLEPHGQWSAVDALRQLEDILFTPVEVRESPDALPLTSTATLQMILREWNYPRQEPILRQKVDRISALLLRTPAETRELAEDYGRVLADYLRRRSPATGRVTRRQPIEPNVRMIISGAVRDLDDLDERRTDLRRRLASGEIADSTWTRLPTTVPNGAGPNAAIR